MPPKLLLLPPIFRASDIPVKSAFSISPEASLVAGFFVVHRYLINQKMNYPCTETKSIFVLQKSKLLNGNHQFCILKLQMLLFQKM